MNGFFSQQFDLILEKKHVLYVLFYCFIFCTFKIVSIEKVTDKILYKHPKCLKMGVMVVYGYTEQSRNQDQVQWCEGLGRGLWAMLRQKSGSVIFITTAWMLTTCKAYIGCIFDNVTFKITVWL